MIYSLVSLAVVCLLAALAGLWVLSRARWFTGLVFGTVGLGAFFLAGATVMAALQLTEFEPLDNDAMLGTATVGTAADRGFRVVLNHARSAYRFDVTGDVWRVRVRRINVPRFLFIGSDRYYVLIENVDARFRRLEDEDNTARNRPDRGWRQNLGTHALDAAFNGEILATQHVAAADGAIYTLNLTGGELRLNPVNTQAESTLD